MNLIRHGDVLLKEVDRPEKLTEIKSYQKYVVAEGEVTGHTHTLSTATKNGIKVFTDTEGNRYLDITGQAKIRHQEHKELKVKPGFYRVDQEREFDPFLSQVRRVAD